MAKKKIIQILGCRPHVVKYIDMGKDFNQVVLWTGQHFDANLSNDLIKDFNIKLDYILSKTTLGEMVTSLGWVLKEEKPDCAIIYGDTRSSLAGALASYEAKVKVAHIEAGVRLKDNMRYEEGVRRTIDVLSNYLFAVNEHHAKNLFDERVKGKVFVVGDILYERVLQNRPHNNVAIMTLHRQELVDDKEALELVLEEIRELADRILFYVHPRTKKMIEKHKIKLPNNICLKDPIGYKELKEEVSKCEMVITDSGGLIREAYLAGVPVRFVGDTEWEDEIMQFGAGNTSKKIKEILKKELVEENWHW